MAARCPAQIVQAMALEEAERNRSQANSNPAKRMHVRPGCRRAEGHGGGVADRVVTNATPRRCPRMARAAPGSCRGACRRKDRSQACTMPRVAKQSAVCDGGRATRRRFYAVVRLPHVGIGGTVVEARQTLARGRRDASRCRDRRDREPAHHLEPCLSAVARGYQLPERFPARVRGAPSLARFARRRSDPSRRIGPSSCGCAAEVSVSRCGGSRTH
jgi:hypothetical protein